MFIEGFETSQWNKTMYSDVHGIRTMQPTLCLCWGLMTLIRYREKRYRLELQFGSCYKEEMRQFRTQSYTTLQSKLKPVIADLIAVLSNALITTFKYTYIKSNLVKSTRWQMNAISHTDMSTKVFLQQQHHHTHTRTHKQTIRVSLEK